MLTFRKNCNRSWNVAFFGSEYWCSSGNYLSVYDRSVAIDINRDMTSGKNEYKIWHNHWSFPVL